MTKHEHIFVPISKTKEKCSLCDQYRKIKKDEFDLNSGKDAEVHYDE